MQSPLSELTNKAMALPIEERTILAQRLWESVEDFVDSDIETAWLNTAERRWMEIQEEKTKCITGTEAVKRTRMSLKTR